MKLIIEIIYILIVYYIGTINTTTTYYVSKGMRLNWVSANYYCQTFGMEMAQFTTQAIFDKVQTLFLANPNEFDGYTNIGGIKISPAGSNPGTWMWLNGQEIDHISKWVPGTPNEYNSAYCLCFQNHGNVMKYEDIHCYNDQLLRFMCQKTVKKALAG